MSDSHEDIRFRILSQLRKVILATIKKIQTNYSKRYAENVSKYQEFHDLISGNKDIPLIIKNERIIKDVGKPDIEVFGGQLLFEVKVKQREFQDGLEQLNRYIPFYPYASYAIITNDVIWEFYEIINGKLQQNTSLTLDNILLNLLISDLKLPLTTENVKNIFTPIILLEEEFFHIFTDYNIKDEALFKAYRNIMIHLYEQANDEIIQRMYIKHTLMQMIVSVCLTEALKIKTTIRNSVLASDINTEIILPYLKWWDSLLPSLKTSDLEFFQSLLISIYSKAKLLNFDENRKEDLFRDLYEILIDAETRRKLGEYYTPLWLVEYMTEEIFQNDEDADKIVLDPFCGSGTFLVSVFYKKISYGLPPEQAIREVIGFDINPLAVSIARAELIMAYINVQGKDIITPLIFNIDSANLLLANNKITKTTSFLPELSIIENLLEFVDTPLHQAYTTKDDFAEILELEILLRICFKNAEKEKSYEETKSTLHSNLIEFIDKEWKGALIQCIVNTLLKEKSIEALSKLISRYGNGVWAVSITSLFAPYIIRRKGVDKKSLVDYIITNPPWILLTIPKGAYGNLLRLTAKKILTKLKNITQIINASDISSVLLHGCLKIANEKIGIVMPDSAVYIPDSYHGLGKILTFNTVKENTGKVIHINKDVFEHGKYPSIILLNKGEGDIKCQSMMIGCLKYSKDLRLEEVTIQINGDEEYKDYISHVKYYLEISSKDLAKKLEVKKVVPKGDYIMGIFGGEIKKGSKQYGGLIFSIESYNNTTKQYNIKLSNLSTSVQIPESILQKYWKKIVYRGKVFPFHLESYYNILLSSSGKEDLVQFLKTHILTNLRGDDKIKVEILIGEVQQPSKLNPLLEDYYYVLYRGSRTFGSFVISPEEITEYLDEQNKEIIIYDKVAYLYTKDKGRAYYYSALLNYLVKKVIANSGSFVRDQFSRPLITIPLVGLEWSNKSWQKQISELGIQMHTMIMKYYEGNLNDGMQVKRCFDIINENTETKILFETITNIFDSQVSHSKLLDALRYVAKF